MKMYQYVLIHFRLKVNNIELKNVSTTLQNWSSLFQNI